MVGCFALPNVMRWRSTVHPSIEAPSVRSSVPRSNENTGSNQTDDQLTRDGACWLPVDLSRDTRITRAIEVMSQTDEGLMWVKMVRAKAVRGQDKPLMVPIKWTKKNINASEQSQQSNMSHCKSVNESDADRDEVDEVHAIAKSKPLHDDLGDVVPDISIHGVENSEQADAASVGSEEKDEENLCVVCMERAANLQLMPCAHRDYCQRCIVETICTWSKSSSPCCPLCRTAFDTLVLLS
mmetsp:Transcript_79991/g.214088  ORF Transcript_79991/g.214088 Transcript_79991/m.214088 type:complete len:239 (-) Transcript_79991:50-766(-)